jgi:hypothetical protein
MGRQQPLQLAPGIAGRAGDAGGRERVWGGNDHLHDYTAAV